MKKLITYCLLITHLNCVAFDFINNKAENGFLSRKFFNELKQVFHPDTFFETGTYTAGTALIASEFFKEVHTTELDQTLYKDCVVKTAVKKNITVYNGQSPEILAKIIPQCQGTILFWLDAHYSGGNTAKSNDNPSDPASITPICKELAAIAQSGVKNCVILIDDMRGFGSRINDTEFLGCWAYPCMQEICQLGLIINPNFAFALLGDMLMMYDQTKYAPTFSPVVIACTQSRLYDGKNLNEQDLVEVEKVIMQKPTQEEKYFITTLYKMMTPCKDPEPVRSFV